MRLQVAILAVAMAATGAAEEPSPAERPLAMQVIKTPGQRAAAREAAKHDAMLERLDKIRELVADDSWLQAIADKAANKGITERPKLPPGVSVTVSMGTPVDNPFGNPFQGSPAPRSPYLKLVAAKNANGKRGRATAIMWVDERTVDVIKLR
jgi:hypothetical protein